jgi:molybdopterin-synthase adenylyltransferase
MIADRALRQRDIVPPERLADCAVTLIGVGAIGRQVALQLAAIGVPKLVLVDFDTVEPANLACQGYLERDLGLPKVDATAGMIRQINSAVEVHAVNERFRRSMEFTPAVFVCVDQIETRSLIWQALEHRVAFFADGRMSAEVVRVLVATNPATRGHYPATLFTAAEAFSGSCTAKSTIFTANIAAGLMIQQFTRWLRHMPVDSDLTLNLLASELVVGDLAAAEA